MIRKLCTGVLIVALPLLFQATTGCVLDTTGAGCDEADCPRPPETSNLNSYVCSCTCSPETRQREVRVSASEDDATQRPDTSVRIDTIGLNLDTVRLIGVRFRDVGIPAGSDVLSAYIEFTSASDDGAVIAYEIVGEASGNAAPFAEINNDISSRMVTASTVGWNPPGWTLDGPEQTPELEIILQEIVDNPGWIEGNALALFISATGGSGQRTAHSYDGKPLSAPLLVVTYEEPASPMVGPQDLPVCVPASFNPNIGGAEATDGQLSADCEARVEGTLGGLAAACGYPSQCDCSVQAGSRRFSATCDNTCVEDLVDADCSDFDPVAGVVDATNAPNFEPVCLANSPLAFGIYGRRTACAVSGVAHMGIEGESADPAAAGILQFRGDPCPGVGCEVGMEYRLDIGSVTFSSLFDSETFDQIAGLGKSEVGANAVLSPAGAGTFAAAACGLSARARRDGEQGALVAHNTDTIGVNVNFGSMGPSCAMNGALIGSADPELKRCEDGGNICTDDGDCADDDSCSEVGESQLLLNLDVAGMILNQPPTADAGTDQTVECPAAGILDASGSSDLDSNIALFSWRRGNRIGPEVGFEEMSVIQQGLGTQTYVLRVIDALGQAGEDATALTVEDTMPPVLSCSVITPVILQTNHDMVNVGLASRARDLCEGELPVAVSIFGDEDDEAQTGDGNFSPDAKNIDIETLRLRAERKGNSDGRVYLILVESTDSSGNRGINCCTVTVPHSRSQSALQSAQAQAAAARTFCLANAGMPPAGYFVVGDGPVIGPKQ